jgi:hypothetical protein
MAGNLGLSPSDSGGLLLCRFRFRPAGRSARETATHPRADGLFSAAYSLPPSLALRVGQVAKGRRFWRDKWCIFDFVVGLCMCVRAAAVLSECNSANRCVLVGRAEHVGGPRPAAPCGRCERCSAVCAYVSAVHDRGGGGGWGHVFTGRHNCCHVFHITYARNELLPLAIIKQDTLFFLQVIWLSILMVVARLVLPLAEGNSNQNLQAFSTGWPVRMGQPPHSPCTALRVPHMHSPGLLTLIIPHTCRLLLPQDMHCVHP